MDIFIKFLYLNNIWNFETSALFTKMDCQGLFASSCLLPRAQSGRVSLIYHWFEMCVNAIGEGQWQMTSFWKMAP